MPIINFRFTKINASKSDLSGSAKINVDESIGIKNISEVNLEFGPNQKAATFEMEFIADYIQNEESKANINIVSEAIYLDEDKKIKELLSNWKAKKPVNPDVVASIHNLALTKSLVHALLLSDSLALPSPINLPKIKVKAMDEKK